MDSALFSLGDIVALRSHPYFNTLTNTVISGDSIGTPPLMVVVELFKAKQNILGTAVVEDIFKYKCIWFSSKSNHFIESLIVEAELKLIEKNTLNICPSTLRRGSKITLRSNRYELAKLKSSLNYEDNSDKFDAGNTIIKSFLSYLPPVMQILDLKRHQSKDPLIKAKTGIPIRVIPTWDIKCLYFNAALEKITEFSLPLEALSLIEEVNETLLEEIEETIKEEAYLAARLTNKDTIVKPKHISYRNGHYFLRAYDLL